MAQAGSAYKNLAASISERAAVSRAPRSKSARDACASGHAARLCCAARVGLPLHDKGPRTHLRRLRRMRTSGRHSRVLWGPGEGLGACTAKDLVTPAPLPRKHARGNYSTDKRRIAHENTAKLVKHPVLGRIEALQVFLDAARHGCESRGQLSTTERGRVGGLGRVCDPFVPRAASLGRISALDARDYGPGGWHTPPKQKAHGCVSCAEKNLPRFQRSSFTR